MGGMCIVVRRWLVLQEVGGLCVMGKWMAHGETGGTQRDEWHAGRRMACRETDGMQGDGWHAGRWMACGETDGTQGDILGVVIIAFMADILNFSDLTCVRKVSGWMGGVMVRPLVLHVPPKPRLHLQWLDSFQCSRIDL